MERPERWGAPDQEKPDTTPIEMPLGMVRPTPLQDLIASMVREAVMQETEDEYETMEESNDFEPDDEEQLLDMSPYTLDDIPDEPVLPPEPEEPEPKPPEPTADPPDPNAEEAS